MLMIEVNTELISYQYETENVKENVALLMKLRDELEKELDKHWEAMMRVYGEP
jgi:ribosome-associated toxin RatA of RatAB toxin-antitoxin module